ncbi:MAG: glycosyltransferase [Candidatus Nanoarchaeia archaeon]|nr:glycosyltransferase [Candidatus Nanoarchaeia archaeon]
MKSNNSLVSVIITTKNSERTLDKCLKSIKQQSYKNIEIIVVDNNSTDKTKEIAKKYTRLVFNKGPERSAQRNFGAEKAKGKYVLIHDSDIYFHKDSVKECVELAEKTGCKAIVLPEKSIGEGYWTKVKAFERSFYIGKDLIESSRFFDKKTFLYLGGYDLNLTACEDWDLQNRLRERGVLIGRVNNILEHDEGRLNLFGSSKKKAYYAKWIKIYKEKYPEIAKKQFNPFYRFPISEILIKGLIHPILVISMIIMKGMEWRSAR